MSDGIPCTCENCVRERERAAFRPTIAHLEAEVAELKLHACELTEVLENRNRTIAELEQLGDAMAFEIEFGRGPLPSSLDAWRKARGTT